MDIADERRNLVPPRQQALSIVAFVSAENAKHLLIVCVCVYVCVESIQ
jgi:hypothetical protein